MKKYYISSGINKIIEKDDENEKSLVVMGGDTYFDMKPYKTRLDLSHFSKKYGLLTEITKEQYDDIANKINAVYKSFKCLENELLQTLKTSKFIAKENFKLSSENELFALADIDRFMWVRKYEDFNKDLALEGEFYYFSETLGSICQGYNDDYDFEDFPSYYIRLQRPQFNKLKNMFSTLTMRISEMELIFYDVRSTLNLEEYPF